MNTDQLLACFIFCLLLPTCLSSQSNIYLSGTFTSSLQLNSIEGINKRKPSHAYAFSGSPTLNVGPIQIPLGFVFSNYQQNTRQSFNQYGISPTYKDTKLHLGYRSVNWSKYSMGGHRFLGFGVETSFRFLRLGYINGKFLRTTVSDTSAISSTPSFYNKKGSVYKIGFGGNKNYFDFIYLKSKDQLDAYVPDSLRAKPNNNTVLGLKSTFEISKSIKFSMDAGISGFTRDSRSETLDDPESEVASFFTRFFMPRISSQINLGLETKLAYSSKKISLDLAYKRIDPGYTSHGIYYLRTDLNQWSFGSRFNIAKGKLIIQGRLGREHDNTKQQKLRTTHRTIYTTNMNIRPSNWSNLNIQYSNFGISQEGSQVSISDTTRLNNITKSIVVTPNIYFVTGLFSHNINLLYSNQSLDDQNVYTQALTQIQARTVNFNYSLTIPKSGLSASMGINRTTSEISIGESTSNGFSVGLAKHIKKPFIRMRANYAWFDNRFKEASNGSTNRLSAILTWRLNNTNQLDIRYNHLENESKNILVSKSFSESTMRVNYTYRFTTQKNKQ